MQGRELISKMFRNFFILVTLIDVVLLICGTLLSPEEQFGYQVFLYPLIYAFAGTLPQVIMYSRHELTVKEVMVRKFIQLLVIELTVNGIIFGENVFQTEYRVLLKVISLSIILVFIMANVLNWVMDSATARRMTRELEDFQKQQGTWKN